MREPETASRLSRGYAVWIVRLRWLAVAGQTLTVLVVHLFLAFPLPLSQAGFLIGALAAANIMLQLWFPSTHRLGPKAALALLGFDLLQMACLLYITGGLANPFAPLYDLSPARDQLGFEAQHDMRKLLYPA